MPFIPEEERLPTIKKFLNCEPITIPGQRCFICYAWIMERWLPNQRWAAIDSILKEITDPHIVEILGIPVDPNDIKDWNRALQLAWDVFFAKHGMDYEDEKCLINGDCLGLSTYLNQVRNGEVNVK